MSLRARRVTRRAVALVHAIFVLLLCASSSAEKLKVYTKSVEPFAFEQNGKAAGFSIDLWERIAKEMDLEYEIQWGKSVGDVIGALERREADVGIAAISITSDREAVVDFSQPFYESGLSILVNAQGQSTWKSLVTGLFTPDFLKLLGAVAVIMILTGHLVWVFERKKNPEQFPEPYLQGVWESTWWSLSTILSGGCDAKGPMAVGGRIVGAAWMLVCIIFITYFTASITTIMTVNQLTSEINGPADLPGRAVATVKGSTAEKYLASHRSEVHAFGTIDEAYAALRDRKVQAVVYDAPILFYEAKRAQGGTQKVVGRLFERQNYGIALPQNSPHRKPMNAVLLKLRESGFIDELQTKWFGNQE